MKAFLQLRTLGSTSVPQLGVDLNSTITNKTHKNEENMALQAGTGGSVSPCLASVGTRPSGNENFLPLGRSPHDGRSPRALIWGLEMNF